MAVASVPVPQCQERVKGTRSGQRRSRRLPASLLGAAAAAAVHTSSRTSSLLGRSFSALPPLERPDCRRPALAYGSSASACSAARLRKPVRPRRALPEALSIVSNFLEEATVRVAELGPLGPLYYFCVYVLAELFAVPATPMTLTAGYLFGLSLGSTIAVMAGCTSASLGFLLTRTFLQPVIAKFAMRSQLYKKINLAVEREGFKIVFLLRLSPLLPFSMTNYAFSLSTIRFRDYFLANFLGFAPATVVFVYFASAARNFTTQAASSSAGHYVLYGLGALVTALLLRQAGLVAKRSLDEAVADEEFEGGGVQKSAASS